MKVSVLVQKCAERLKKGKLTLAFAESVTAGCLCHVFGALPGCGSFFKGGIVAYDAEIKKNLLGLSQETLSKYTPESAEVTRAMALGLHNCIPADCLVAVTGLNTPGGSESAEKPVGTVFIHAIIRQKEYAIKQCFNGDPESINKQIVQEVCSLLLNAIAK